MSKEKLTDEQIMKALEWCVASNTCGDCPLLKIKENCRPFLYKQSLNLINRLKENNENYEIHIRNLEKSIDRRDRDLNSQANRIIGFKEEIAELKAENERLKTDNLYLAGFAYGEDKTRKKTAREILTEIRGYYPGDKENCKKYERFIIRLCEDLAKQYGVEVE